MMQDTGIIIAILTAILTAYIAFLHQQRLKAFELFYGRRNDVIKDIEIAINRLFEVQTKLRKNEPYCEFKDRAFLDGLVLHHKIQGANFGKTANLLGRTYFSIIQEPIKAGSIKREDIDSWLERQLTCLSAIHGFAHNELSREMRFLTRSRIDDFFSHISEQTRNSMEPERRIPPSSGHE
jgi:hypothetical protein